MPVKNGKIYSEVVNGVKIGIGWYEVAALLGCGADEGQCCTSPRINMNSRMKPIIKDTPAELTEEDMLKANWGLNIQETSMATARANGMGSWTYNRPGATDWKRIHDFDGYDHYATSPMLFSFNDLSDTMAFDTLSGVPPVILVRWRPDGVKASQGIGVNGIYLSDMLYGGTTTEKMQNLLPCVTQYVNGVLFVANATHTLGETDYLDSNAIVLENFNIWQGGWINSSPSDWLGTVNIPSDATNVKYMYLYPRINKVGNANGIYMGTGGAPTTTKGGNGYYNQNATYPFIGVPQSNKLTLIKYEYSPITVEMNYVESIVYGNTGTSIIGMWPFLDQNNLSYNNPSIPTFGQSGRTIPFSVAPIIVRINCTLYNSASYAVTIRPTTITGGGTTIGPIPNNSISLVESDGNSATSASGYISIPANSSKTLTIVSSYNAGQYPDYTFPSISYGYGSFYVLPKLKMLVNTSWRDEFTPNQHSVRKALNWK